MNRRHVTRSRAVQSRSTEELRIKLSNLISRNEQLKLSFNQLSSQIRAGLLEAEDVFASLAIPLMQLVGLKKVEMASEGRFSTIVISSHHSQSQDEDFMDRALTAGNELLQRQKEQLMELMRVLRNVEAQVNSSRNNILDSLANHQNYTKEFIQQAATYVSENHQSCSRNDLLGIIQKLLKTTFHLVGDSFGSVEDGVNGLTRSLANEMCKPMVNYVNNRRKELKAGTCSRLLELVKEMEGAIIARNLELEETRRRVSLAEKSKIESISKLKEAEETTRKLTLSLGLLTGDVIESEETSTQQQEASIVKEDQADNMLWDLLRNKRKRQVPDSPIGLEGLLGIRKTEKKLSLPRATSSLDHRRVTRSQAKGFQPQILLGSSPSATIQKFQNRRRATP